MAGHIALDGYSLSDGSYAEKRWAQCPSALVKAVSKVRFGSGAVMV